MTDLRLRSEDSKEKGKPFGLMSLEINLPNLSRNSKMFTTDSTLLRLRSHQERLKLPVMRRKSESLPRAQMLRETELLKKN